MTRTNVILAAALVALLILVMAVHESWLPSVMIISAPLIPVLIGALLNHWLFGHVTALAATTAAFMISGYWLSPSSPDVGPWIGFLQTVYVTGIPVIALGVFGVALRRLAGRMRQRRLRRNN